MNLNTSSQSYARTDSDQHGFVLVAGDNSEKSLSQEFERIIWSFYLSNDWKSPVPAYGSTVFEILNDWTHRYSIKTISQFAVKYQNKVDRLENLLYEGKCHFSELSKSCLGGEATVDTAKLKAWHLDAVNEFPEHSDSFLKLSFALHKDYKETFI